VVAAGRGETAWGATQRSLFGDITLRSTRFYYLTGTIDRFVIIATGVLLTVSPLSPLFYSYDARNPSSLEMADVCTYEPERRRRKGWGGGVTRVGGGGCGSSETRISDGDSTPPTNRPPLLPVARLGQLKM
jgi:hypothetical protein